MSKAGTLSFLGTQSPDAVNKLLRLSDSSHQIKNRAPQRLNHPASSSSLASVPASNSASPLTNSSTASTGLSSLAEPTHQHLHHHRGSKIRDTNKLSSESSSLNFKQPNAATSFAHRTRHHNRKVPGGVHSPILSFSFSKNSTRIATKCQRRVERVHAVMIPDAAVSIRRIRVRVHSIVSREHSRHMRDVLQAWAMQANIRPVPSAMDSPRFEFEIDRRYLNRIPFQQVSSIFLEARVNRSMNVSIGLLLATRHDDVHVPKLMRTWLQHTQSQTEVNANNGHDPGG